MASLASLPSLHALSTEARGSRRLHGKQQKDEKFEGMKLRADDMDPGRRLREREALEKRRAELKKAKEERELRKQELAAAKKKADEKKKKKAAKKAAATGMGWEDDLRDRWAPVRQRTRHDDDLEMDDEMFRLREERQRQEEEYEEAQRLKEAEYNLYKAEEQIKVLEEKVAELQKRISEFEMDAMQETLQAQAPRGWRPAK
ncbi:hypothetical protein [Thioclava electrotropha]|uniref:hypothetical protein n=1 Tax=Thioclava electrotropha TaxID=1549850 RepID=UPI0023A8C631|nr:hypothetical protein [Thioclava electrotropha]